ncbi:MAG TPA: UvrD-helicase domain-containing protein [Patescibacteria group bacterium]|jgi:DNA helicase-2/ATP-dependent DNA helicase PcrA|nr:UvrD-helicase domain-containing protein [Patescibacteria group bacterium]
MTIRFEHFLTNELNELQRRAVLYNNGPLLIIAGAGSGKTRVIVARIAFLLQVVKVSPASIVALTFTNKAAREMKERIIHLLDTNNLPFVGTFHAYCLLLLKKYFYDNPFTIIDSDDQEKIIKQLLEKKNTSKEVSVRSIVHQLSLVRNRQFNFDKMVVSDWGSSLLYEIFIAYEQEKKVCNYMDFDDLLIKTVHLLKTDPAFKKRVSNQLTHILVDEYQDTNVMQHELIKQLAIHENSLAQAQVCVVGDEDQSIYSWRGATVTNMHTFTVDFPNTTMIKIEQNYRSMQPILSVANALIAHNTQRVPKVLWSLKAGKNRTVHVISGSDYQETDRVITALALFKKQYQSGSNAILYRTHTQSRTLEEGLIKQGIAYRIVGGTQFYERAEIKDLIAYLKLIVNPFDRISFLRIINTPARGLGTKCEELFKEIWQEQPFLNFHEVLEKIITEKRLPSTKINTIQHFLSFFIGLSPHTTSSIAIDTLLHRTQYISYLKATYEEDNAVERIENIKELMSAAKHFGDEGCVSITQFLEEVALLNEKITSAKESNDAVLLMTLHAAKGLEFDFVCITGVEEQILPTPRSYHDNEALEEERRLLYVGITRAKEFLMLSSAKSRFIYGTPSRQFSSRFFDDIPVELLPSFDSSYWTERQAMTFLNQWFTQQTFTESLQKVAPSQVAIKKIATQNSSFKKSMSESKKANVQFKKNQKVKHSVYGIGTIQSLDSNNDQKTYALVRFFSGLKKIITSFLEPV